MSTCFEIILYIIYIFSFWSSLYSLRQQMYCQYIVMMTFSLGDLLVDCRKENEKLKSQVKSLVEQQKESMSESDTRSSASNPFSLASLQAAQVITPALTVKIPLFLLTFSLLFKSAFTTTFYFYYILSLYFLCVSVYLRRKPPWAIRQKSSPAMSVRTVTIIWVLLCLLVDTDSSRYLCQAHRWHGRF